MAMAYIDMAFETNTAMNHVNKCKSAHLSNRLVGKMLEDLRKWEQPSHLTAMLKIKADLSR